MEVVNLTSAKTYMGISNSDYDDKINIIVDAVNSHIENEIGNINKGTKTDTKKLSEIGYRGDIILDIPNVETIDEIEGQTYEGIEDTDYKIVSNRRVIIKDIINYLNTLEFRYFTIKYTAGYDSIPKDLELAGLILVSKEFNKDSGKEITSYSLGPEDVEMEKGEYENNVLGRYKRRKIYSI